MSKVGGLCAVLCTLPCKFWALYILFRHAKMSAYSQLDSECHKGFNNKINISNKSVKYNDSKALIMEVIWGLGVKFVSNTVKATKNTRR
jgi:hypothetical protein